MHAPKVSRNYTLLSDMDAEDAPAPLLYTDEAQGSHFFRRAPTRQLPTRCADQRPVQGLLDLLAGACVTAAQGKPAERFAFRLSTTPSPRAPTYAAPLQPPSPPRPA